MIPRRIWVNLAAFLLLFAVLCNWAVRNVLSLDAIENSVPDHGHVRELAWAAGQRRGDLPRRVGRGRSTRLHLSEADGVVVELDIDRGTRLPVGLTAAVRRKSAVGEPYVALEAPRRLHRRRRR